MWEREGEGCAWMFGSMYRHSRSRQERRKQWECGGGGEKNVKSYLHVNLSKGKRTLCVPFVHIFYFTTALTIAPKSAMVPDKIRDESV